MPRGAGRTSLILRVGHGHAWPNPHHALQPLPPGQQQPVCAFAITGPAAPPGHHRRRTSPSTGAGNATTGADRAPPHPRCAHYLEGDRLGL